VLLPWRLNLMNIATTVAWVRGIAKPEIITLFPSVPPYPLGRPNHLGRLAVWADLPSGLICHRRPL
jgi:hypothetical protein